MAANHHTPLDLVVPTSNWPKLLIVDSPNIANPSIKWRLGSRFVVPTVGLFSKFWMTLANNSTVHNAAVLYEALNQNYLASRSTTKAWFSSQSTIITPRRPLITYSNHASCLDDPLMWGALLPLKWQFNSDRHRWSGAAAEVCFSKKWHSMFFSLGKTFPIIRGEGIHLGPRFSVISLFVCLTFSFQIPRNLSTSNGLCGQTNESRSVVTFFSRRQSNSKARKC